MKILNLMRIHRAGYTLKKGEKWTQIQHFQTIYKGSIGHKVQNLRNRGRILPCHVHHVAVKISL